MAFVALTLAVALAAAFLPGSQAAAQSPFVPRSLAAYEACRKAAQASHPGELMRVSTRVTSTLYHIRLYIERKNGAEVVVICDGTSGEIVRVVNIDD